MSTLTQTQSSEAAREDSRAGTPMDLPGAGSARVPAAAGTRYYRFKPLNIGRWVIWSLFALLLLVAPLVWTTSLAHTMLSQMGIAIIVCLSYNMLLGQGGMLSFGHAVYSGLGSFLAIHTLNLVSKGQLPLPVSLIPIVGGISGLLFAVVFGSVTTK